MRSINVQDAIVRLAKKLDHLDLNKCVITGQYEPSQKMDPQDRSVFQIFWVLRDLQEYYYSQLRIDTLTKEDPLTQVYSVSCCESAEGDHELNITAANVHEDYLSHTCRLKDLTGLHVVFSEHTTDAMTRMDGLKCPFLFHFVI